MHTPSLTRLSSLLKHHPKTLVAFALFTEFLMILLGGFMILFSLEILLPTFVSARINLALLLGVILILFLLHHFLSLWLSCPIRIPTRLFFFIPLSLLGLWGCILLALSLMKFPAGAIGTIILFFLAIGFLLRKTFLRSM